MYLLSSCCHAGISDHSFSEIRPGSVTDGSDNFRFEVFLDDAFSNTMADGFLLAATKIIPRLSLESIKAERNVKYSLLI